MNDLGESTPAREEDRRDSRGALAALVLLTAIGAFLRFWRLGFQSYWADEALTVRRIDGTLEHLFASLSNQGFPPGWYLLLAGWSRLAEYLSGDWALAFSAAVARVPPAIFGTLTVPALFLLARRFVDRRGALLVSALAAVNPFLVYYSRDAKMYAAFWFFVVANMAIHLDPRWRERPWSWGALFALTGLGMTALHPLAAFVPLLQLIHLSSAPRSRRPPVAPWLVGVGISALVPLYWFGIRLADRNWIGRVSGEANPGLQWIPRYTDMSWRTLAGTLTEHVFGFLWPVYPPDARIRDWFSLGDDFPRHLATRSSATLAHLELGAAIVLLALFAVGLIRGWAATRRDRRESSTGLVPWWWLSLWLLLPQILLAATWIPPGSSWYRWLWLGFEPRPIWEPRYLGIVVPPLLIALAAALRRLPTRSLRRVALGFVLVGSLVSSLTNHLIYRNAPFARAAAVAARFGAGEPLAAIAIAAPATEYSAPAARLAHSLALGLRPSPGTRSAAWRTRGWILTNSARGIRSWLAARAEDAPRTRTIVLTDRSGDLASPAHPLSDASLGKLLGPRWRLVHQESYRWRYEWRYYLFHVWRTRVWRRVPADGSTAPSATPVAAQSLAPP